MFNQKALLAALISLSLVSCSTAGGESEASAEADVTNAQTSNDSETSIEQSDPSQDSPTSTAVSSSTTGTVAVPSGPTTSQDIAPNVRPPEPVAPTPQTDPETDGPPPQTDPDAADPPPLANPDPNGYEAFRFRTYAQVYQLGRASLETDFVGEFLLEFSPGFDPEKAVRLTADIENAFKPWQPLTRSKGIKVVVADENGSEFFLDQMPPNSNCPGTEGHKAFDPPQPGSQMGFGCWNQSGDYIMYLGLHSADDGWASFSLHHEVTHLAQAGITPKIWDTPCFYTEGEAQFFGRSLSAPAPQVGEYNLAFYSLWQISGKFGLISINDWVDFLLSRENRNGPDCWEDYFNYHVGGIMVERAYGEFGAPKWDLWRASLGEGDWRVSFRGIFGVEPTDWYRDSLVPYLKYWCEC